MKGTELSIIIPALNEAIALPATLARAEETFPDAEVIVVDGGSGDETRDISRQAGAAVMRSPRGRGCQCRVGAAAAAGKWLLFLHADTLLPKSAAAVLRGFRERPGARVATFRLRFDTGSWFLRTCAWCSRFDTIFTRFGDQGILVRRDVYHEIGGFPDWPLMEDVEFLRRARRVRPVISLPAAVETSARRFRRNHEFRQQMRNAILLLRFLTGTPPEVLACVYHEEKAPHSPRVDGIPASVRSAR